MDTFVERLGGYFVTNFLGQAAVDPIKDSISSYIIKQRQKCSYSDIPHYVKMTFKLSV